MNPTPPRQSRRPVLRARAAIHLGHPERWILQFARPRRFSDLDWLFIALFGVVLILGLADRFKLGLPTFELGTFRWGAKETAIALVALVVLVWLLRRNVGRRIRERIVRPFSPQGAADKWLLAACFVAFAALSGFNLYRLGWEGDLLTLVLTLAIAAVAALAVVALRRSMQAAANARQQAPPDVDRPESVELRHERITLRFPDRMRSVDWDDVAVRNRTLNTFTLQLGRDAKVIVYSRAFGDEDESEDFRTWVRARSAKGRSINTRASRATL